MLELVVVIVKKELSLLVVKNNFMSEKSRSTAFLLSFFLGVFGAHRFYTGKGGTAVAQLLLTCSIFGIIVSGIWNLVDCIMILSGSFEDAKGLKISNW